MNYDNQELKKVLRDEINGYTMVGKPVSAWREIEITVYVPSLCNLGIDNHEGILEGVRYGNAIVELISLTVMRYDAKNYKYRATALYRWKDGKIKP